MGWLRVRSRLTRNEAETSFVVIHYGGVDFHTALRKADAPEKYEAFKRQLFHTYLTGSLADVTALVAREYQGRTYRLDDLFLEEQRRVIGIVLQDRFTDYQRSFERLADQDEDVMTYLGRLHYPIPKPLRAAASVCLDQRLRQEIQNLGTNGSLGRIRQFIERGRVWGYLVETTILGRTLTEELQTVLGEINSVSDLPTLASHAGQILETASLLGIQLDLWQAQNQLLDEYAEVAASGPLNFPLREAFANLAVRLNLSPELLGWRP
jgi:hypothetical protein